MSAGTRLLSIGSVVSAVISGSLLHPYVTGQVAHTTHQGAPIGAGLWAASTVFIALALMLGLIAYREHIPAVNRAVSSTTTKRAVTVAVVGLVVSTAALGGVGGPASPVGSADAQLIASCDGDSAAVLYSILGLDLDFCTASTNSLETYENMTQTDTYASAVTFNHTSNSFHNSHDNFANDAYSNAMARAHLEVINGLANNETESEILNDSKGAVDDYYVNVTSNVLEDYSGRATQAAYTAHALDTNNDGEANVTEGMSVWTDPQEYHPILNETATVNVTFVNGETKDFKAPIFRSSGAGNMAILPVSDSGDDRVLYQTSDFDAATNSSEVTLRDAPYTFYPATVDYSNGNHWGHSPAVNESDHGWQAIVAVNGYADTIDELGEQRTQAHSNLDTYVNETYQEVQNGNLTVEEIAGASPHVLGTQAATEYDSTGYHGYTAAQLAALGVSGDLNASHVVNTTWVRPNETGATVSDPVTVTGTLFYTGEDSQVFESGVEYDPSALTGEVYLTVSTMTYQSDGTSANYSSGLMHVDQNFTITEAVNTQTGEVVNNTTMETRDFTSTNVSQLEDRIGDLKAQRDELERKLEDAAAASGGSSSSNTILIAAIALTAGGALMYRRDND